MLRLLRLQDEEFQRFKEVLEIIEDALDDDDNRKK